VVTGPGEVAETMSLLSHCSSDQWTIHVDPELLAPPLPFLVEPGDRAAWREESTS